MRISARVEHAEARKIDFLRRSEGSESLCAGA
jgi:hypothetical protein